MSHIAIIITGNSNQRLDVEAAAIVTIAKQTGAVKAGPIPFKGKRVIHIYGCNGRTLDRLMLIKPDKKLHYDVQDLSVRQSD